MLNILITLLCLFICLPSYAATLTVGSGQTFTTIQAGVNAANPGDVVNVLAGTYNETVSSSRAGSAGNYITIQTSVGAITNKFRIIHDYVKVIGFTLNRNINCTGGGEDAYFWTTASHIEIRNNVITVPGNAECYGGRTDTKGQTDILFYGNTVDGSNGVAFDIGGTYIKAENNIIRNGTQDAFRTEGCSHCTIRGNEVYGMRETGNHTDFVQTFGDNGYYSSDVLVENNYVHDSELQWAMLTPDEYKIPANAISNYTFRNNVFTNLLNAGQPGVNGLKVYNNVFYNVGLGNIGVAIHIDCAFLTGTEIKNNIFVGTANGHSGGYDDDSCSSAQRANLSADYNHYAQLSTWGAVGEYREAHGQNGGNPLFVSAASSGGKWQLQAGSPCINTGTTIPNFSTDILGNTRPQGSAWDKGAYEYGGVSEPSINSPKGLIIK
jgi:hypothetical protein